MKTYVFLNWTSGEGVHVAELQLIDDEAALAHLATLSAGCTCEERDGSESREVTTP